MALNSKQKQFYKEWLIDANATQSAIRAGYSKKTAYSQGQRLLKNVEGQKYLAELMSEKDKTLIAEQDEVLEYITSVMRDDIQATRDRLEAAKMLGKRYGIFTDKIEASVNDTTRSELQELLAQRKARGEPNASK